MVPIVKQLCPPERYGIKCPYSRTPDRIVVHNTGNCVSAKNEVTYMINRSEKISFHEAVDDVEIRQGLPFERNAWASGDGRGDGNMKGIHIEICYSKYVEGHTSLTPAQVEAKFLVAERNAAEHIAILLNEYGLGLDKVTKHQDYDGKYCPHRTLDLGWDRFLNMIEKYYKGAEEMTEAQVRAIARDEFAKLEKESAAKPAAKWAEAKIAKVIEHGIMSGDQNGEFHPQSNMSRQEAAVVFANFLDKMEGRNEKV